MVKLSLAALLATTPACFKPAGSTLELPNDRRLALSGSPPGWQEVSLKQVRGATKTLVEARYQLFRTREVPLSQSAPEALRELLAARLANSGGASSLYVDNVRYAVDAHGSLGVPCRKYSPVSLLR